MQSSLLKKRKQKVFYVHIHILALFSYFPYSLILARQVHTYEYIGSFHIPIKLTVCFPIYLHHLLIFPSYFNAIQSLQYFIIWAIFEIVRLQWIFSPPYETAAGCKCILLHQPLLSLPASRSWAVALAISVAHFVSFLHLLVLFPVPIPGSIPAEFY